MSTAALKVEACVPVLTGYNGWVEGERYVLKEGTAVVIGRSRSCDISLRRISSYLQRAPDERDGDHDFNTVSRRHLRITVDKGVARIEDLSTNGSYCDDVIMDEVKEFDLRDASIILRMGTRESFRLQLLGPQDTADTIDGQA